VIGYTVIKPIVQKEQRVIFEQKKRLGGKNSKQNDAGHDGNTKAAPAAIDALFRLRKCGVYSYREQTFAE
jgi:hypothetical protein